MYLITERCFLSKPTFSDKATLLQLFSDENTRAFLGGKQSDAEIEARCSKVIAGIGMYHATVRSRETKECLGLLSLGLHHEGYEFEISYEFLPEYWGQGYAGEALRIFLPTVMQKLSLSTVLAETQLCNIRSIRLLEKFGMKQIHQLERFGAMQVVYRFGNSN